MCPRYKYAWVVCSKQLACETVPRQSASAQIAKASLLYINVIH